MDLAAAALGQLLRGGSNVLRPTRPEQRQRRYSSLSWVLAKTRRRRSTSQLSRGQGRVSAVLAFSGVVALRHTRDVASAVAVPASLSGCCRFGSIKLVRLLPQEIFFLPGCAQWGPAAASSRIQYLLEVPLVSYPLHQCPCCVGNLWDSLQTRSIDPFPLFERQNRRFLPFGGPRSSRRPTIS